MKENLVLFIINCPGDRSWVILLTDAFCFIALVLSTSGFRGGSGGVEFFFRGGGAVENPETPILKKQTLQLAVFTSECRKSHH